MKTTHLPKQTIILDLDGTIVDTKELHHNSFEWAIQQQDPSFVLTSQLRQQLEGLSTLTKVDMFNNTPAYSIKPLDKQLVYDQKQQHTNANMAELSWDPLLPDVLERVSERYTLAIASNARSKFVYSVLQAMKLTCFTVVYTAEFVPQSLRKPNPHMFTTIMNILNADPEHTSVYEDSPVGISAATASGVTHVHAVKNSTDTRIRLELLL
jgi:HAD superfamily hydrolase (TIGR01509 family)